MLAVHKAKSFTTGLSYISWVHQHIRMRGKFHGCLCCRKPDRCRDVSNWASTTIDMLRRKIQNLEDENVNLKVGTFSSTFSFVADNSDVVRCKYCRYTQSRKVFKESWWLVEPEKCTWFQKRLLICFDWLIDSSIITDRVSQEGKAIGSVFSSVRFFTLCLLNWLIFELEFLCVWVIIIALLALKVKVIRQGQRSVSSAYGHSNVVTRTV